MYNLQKRLGRNFPKGFLALVFLCPAVFSQQISTKSPDDAQIFRKCWLYPVDESNAAGVASDNISELYLSISNGKLISINPQTIEKLWETNLGGSIVSEMLVDRDNIYVSARESEIPQNENGGANIQTNAIQQSKQILYSLDKITGIPHWQNKTAVADKTYLYDMGYSLIIVQNDGAVYSLDKTDGRLVWTKNLGSNLSARPFRKSNEIVLGTVDKQITYISSKDGETVRKLEVSEQPGSIAENITGDSLFIGDRKGTVLSFSKKKRKPIWKLRLGAEISDLRLTAQGLLISSLDNFVYLVSETDGKLIWKKRLPGRIAAEPQIRNNLLIINSINESAAFVFELDSGKLVNKITLEDENFFTGEATQLKNLFIFATRRGIVSFSQKDDSCLVQENRL